MHYLCPELAPEKICPDLSKLNLRPGVDRETALAISNGTKTTDLKHNVDGTLNSNAAFKVVYVIC